MVYGRRQMLGGLIGAAAALWAGCFPAARPAAGAEPAKRDRYIVTATIEDTDRVPAIVSGLEAAGCGIKDTSERYLKMLGTAKSVTSFICVTERTAAGAVIGKLRGDKTIKKLEVAEDSEALRAGKLAEELSPYVDEYEKNRELFKTLPIAAAFMREKAELLGQAKASLGAAGKSVDIEISLTKFHSKDAPLPPDLVRLQQAIMENAAKGGESRESERVEQADQSGQ